MRVAFFLMIMGCGRGASPELPPFVDCLVAQTSTDTQLSDTDLADLLSGLPSTLVAPETMPTGVELPEAWRVLRLALEPALSAEPVLVARVSTSNGAPCGDSLRVQARGSLVLGDGQTVASLAGWVEFTPGEVEADAWSLVDLRMGGEIRGTIGPDADDPVYEQVRTLGERVISDLAPDFNWSGVFPSATVVISGGAERREVGLVARAWAADGFQNDRVLPLLSGEWMVQE